MRDDEGHGRRAIRCELAARIEAKPAHPQHARAGDGEREIVRHHLRMREAPARTDHNTSYQRGHGGGDVYDNATREIDDAGEAEERARLVPDAVAARHIDHEAPHHAEDQDGLELHALGKRADEQPRRNEEKHHLVGEVQQLGDVRAVAAHGGGCDATEEDFAETTDDAAAV